MEKEFIRERTDNSLNPRKTGEPSSEARKEILLKVSLLRMLFLRSLSQVTDRLAILLGVLESISLSLHVSYTLMWWFQVPSRHICLGTYSSYTSHPPPFQRGQDCTSFQSWIAPKKRYLDTAAK